MATVLSKSGAVQRGGFAFKASPNKMCHGDKDISQMADYRHLISHRRSTVLLCTTRFGDMEFWRKERDLPPMIKRNRAGRYCVKRFDESAMLY